MKPKKMQSGECRAHWVSAKTPPKEDGLYIIYAPTADPKKPLLMECWRFDGRWQLIAYWDKAITHWCRFPRRPR